PLIEQTADHRRSGTEIGGAHIHLRFETTEFPLDVPVGTPDFAVPRTYVLQCANDTEELLRVLASLGCVILIWIVPGSCDETSFQIRPSLFMTHSHEKSSFPASTDD